MFNNFIIYMHIYVFMLNSAYVINGCVLDFFKTSKNIKIYNCFLRHYDD